MKYLLIAGEASGDLHGSRLIEAVRRRDPEAEFRFLGGDLMAEAVGTPPIIHYRDMAYMGFIDVIGHLPTILGFLRRVKAEIRSWQPGAVVLIDYPSFNLKVAHFAHRLGISVHYFISPKVWAWKQWRVKSIRRDVDHMYCILPFEPAWYRQRNYVAEYVGNPTVGEIDQWLTTAPTREDFCASQGLDPAKPVIAIVPGSRRTEINDNLPIMLDVARRHPDFQTAIAMAPGIDRTLYEQIIGSQNGDCTLVDQATWALMRHARAALVTSGTATLETALLGTPQVACYRWTGKRWTYKVMRKLLSGNYCTLPNLIDDSEVVPEMLVHLCTPDGVDAKLTPLLDDGNPALEAQLDGYRRIRTELGSRDCAETAAKALCETS